MEDLDFDVLLDYLPDVVTKKDLEDMLRFHLQQVNDDTEVKKAVKVLIDGGLYLEMDVGLSDDDIFCGYTKNIDHVTKWYVKNTKKEIKL